MSRKIGLAIALAVLVGAPSVVYPILLMKLLCFALFACAFNFLVGYTGLLSFGHAAFFGGAGYVTAYALTALKLPVELGLLLGMTAAAIAGAVIGSLAIRRKGIYFTMITLALAQMLYFFFLQAPFTGGENGLQGVPRGTLLGTLDLSKDLTLYYVVLAVAIAGFAVIVRMIHSPFGHVLKAIKENEPRAVSLGYDIDKYKLLAFVLSAALSGLAGAMQTVVLGFETLGDAHWSMSGMVILMVLIGGMGTITGPIVGAVIIVVLENKVGDLGAFLAKALDINAFNSLGESVTIVIGLIFVICVLAFRRGVVGEISVWLGRRSEKHKAVVLPRVT